MDHEEAMPGNEQPVSHPQVLFSSPTSSSFSPVAFPSSSWRQHWASTLAREASQPGGRSAPSLKVSSCVPDSRESAFGVINLFAVTEQFSSCAD